MAKRAHSHAREETGSHPGEQALGYLLMEADLILPTKPFLAIV
jgi:hypothetical protein